MRLIAPDRTDIPPLPPSLRGGQVLRREQRLHGRRAAEYDVRFAHRLFQQPLVFAEVAAQDAEFRVGAQLIMVDGIEFLHQTPRTCEGAVDDVDVLDVVAAQQERDPDVPEGLFPRAEDGEGVDVRASVQDDGGGERGAEGGELLGVDETYGGAGAVEEGERSAGRSALGACEGGAGRWCVVS